MSSILVLPGDGIGPEIVDEALRVLKAAQKRFDLDIQLDHALVGGAAYDAEGDPPREYPGQGARRRRHPVRQHRRPKVGQY